MRKLLLLLIVFLMAVFVASTWAGPPAKPLPGVNSDGSGGLNVEGNVAIGAKLVMPTESTLPADDTTPSVSGDSNWVTANTGATSITRLDDLTACEVGYIRINDANTTFDCSSSNIIGNGGSDYTASSGEIIFYYSPDGTNAYIMIGKPDAGGGDSDAIHDNVTGEIAAIAAKATVVDGDMMMLEDSAASNAKKMVTMTQLWANYFKAKADALYLTAETLSTGAGEINGLSEKASPVSADLVVVEDSEDSNNKKKVQVGNLPGGTDDQTAAEVSFTPAGTIEAVTVQAAIEEVATEGGGGTDDQTAAEVAVTSAGNIAADDVQEALEELDSEKESHTSNDIDPDRLNGDTVDDNLIDQVIIAGLSSAGVATPGFTAYDSGNPGADKMAGDIYWNDDGTGADGSEDSDWFIRAMIGGTLSDILRYDNSDAQLEATVDLNLAEDLEVATGKHITVGANQWDNGSDKIDGAMIEDDGVDSPQYAAGSIDNEHLADNAVGNDEMADDAVDSAEIADGAVDNAHLSNDAALPTVISGDPDSLDDTLATNPKLYRGGFIRYNAAGEATLDAFSVAGENVSIMFYPSVAIIVNPNASQTITRNGVALAEGEALINDSNYGLCVLTYLGTNSIDAQCSPDITQETE